MSLAMGGILGFGGACGASSEDWGGPGKQHFEMVLGTQPSLGV